MATQSPLEFIYHVNATVNPDFFSRQVAVLGKDGADEAAIMVEWSDSKAKSIEQSKAIFAKSSAREYDFIVNKKLRSNAMMLKEGKSEVTRGADFRQIVVEKEGKYVNNNIRNRNGTGAGRGGKGNRIGPAD